MQWSGGVSVVDWRRDIFDEIRIERGRKARTRVYAVVVAEVKDVMRAVALAVDTAVAMVRFALWTSMCVLVSTTTIVGVAYCVSVLVEVMGFGVDCAPR